MGQKVTKTTTKSKGARGNVKVVKADTTKKKGK